jgi:arylsulfatase A-like enzyme
MKNVILITIDTLRRDVFGCYGNWPSLTPFMDSVQNNCIRFEKAYATGPYTQASFPGILTSTYYLEDGRQMVLPSEKTLISEAVKKEGVITAAFHSNPYLSEHFGWNRGWDTFYDSIDDDVPDLYPFIRGKQINKKVETWLSGNIRDDMDRAFFLWVHYMDVHEPYVPEDEFVKIVDANLKLEKEEMFGLFREVILKRDISDKENVGLLKKLYSAKVLEVDSCVRELFHVFELAGVLDKSIIFFASDHGDEFGEHGGLSHDGKMYTELVGVPLFIYDRDRSSGEVYTKPVSNINISPTIAYLFGLEKVKGFKGSSLLPVGEFSTVSCFGEAINKRGHREKKDDKPIYYCLRDNRKIIFNKGTVSWELYDIEDDPGEKRNIIDADKSAGDLKWELEGLLQKRQQT